MFGLFFGALEVYNLIQVCTGSIGALIPLLLMAPFLGFFYTSMCSFSRLIDARRQRKATTAKA